MLNLNSYQEALVAYERAEHLKDDETQIYTNKAKALLALLKFDEALIAYDRLISLIQIIRLIMSIKVMCLVSLEL